MTNALRNTKFAIIATVTLLVLMVALTTGRAEAACPTVDTSRGTVTSTINVPSSGNYRVWTRMQASSSTNDSYVLEIDDTVCGVVVGDTGVSTSSWQWVDYKSGSTSNKVTVNLSAGQHTVRMIGREDNVKLDKLLFLSDTSCTPTGFGENCEVETDTESPNISISSPTNNSSISGTVIVQANASDNVGVTKVEFYINDTLLNTDLQSPYSYNLNTEQYTNGSYRLSARAFDAAGNNRRSDEITININNVLPDTTPPQLSITSPVNGGGPVSGTINVSSVATDESGIDRLEIFVDNNKVATLTNSFTYQLDTTQYSKGSHTIKVVAFDKSANANSAEKTVTINIDNGSTTPTPRDADFNNSGEVDLGDLAILILNYGKPVSVGTNGDCTGDGAVDLADLATLILLYGRTV
ncbi:hypothetical protein KC950_03705 [Candidatus Saccharibacteria bacterium]|nr:hypothetical protein [Candidatus Saccharibacteria bacterium]